MQMFEVREKDARFGKAMISYHRSLEEAQERIERSVMTDRNGEHPGIEYLEILVIERDSHPCSLCGNERENDPDSTYTYCRSCHYSGGAAEDLREGQMDFFRTQLVGSGGTVGIEHTGGGCMWLAFRWKDEVEFYTATMTDAFLPEDEDGNAIRHEWGMLCMQYDSEERWEEFEVLHDSGYEDDAGGLKKPRLTDQQLVTIVLAHRQERLS